MLNDHASLSVFLEDWIRSHDSDGVIRSWLSGSADIDNASLFPAVAVTQDGFSDTPDKKRIVRCRIRIFVYDMAPVAERQCKDVTEFVYYVLKNMSPVGTFPVGWGGLRDMAVDYGTAYPESGGYVFVGDLTFNMLIC